MKQLSDDKEIIPTKAMGEILVFSSEEQEYTYYMRELSKHIEKVKNPAVKLMMASVLKLINSIVATIEKEAKKK